MFQNLKIFLDVFKMNLISIQGYRSKVKFLQNMCKVLSGYMSYDYELFYTCIDRYKYEQHFLYLQAL